MAHVQACPTVGLIRSARGNNDQCLRRRPCRLGAALGLLAASLVQAADRGDIERITIASSAMYRTSAYPSVARLADDRLLCVFSATDARHTEGKAVVVGMFSHDHGATWDKPIMLIDSRPHLDYDPNIIVVGSSVIVSSTTVPPTHGQFISTSRTMAVRSENNGETWSKPYEIPMGHRYTSGKINNGLLLTNGAVIFPYSWDRSLQGDERLKSEGEEDCLAAVMISTDRGKTWESGADVHLLARRGDDRAHAINGLDEPAVVVCSDDSLYMLCRTGHERLYELRSRDHGRTWSGPEPSPLTGHNAPASLCRFEGARSGILVVWDHSPKNRWPLCIAASFDDARTWSKPITIANTPGYQCSYPGCIQAADGRLIVVWQQQLEGGGREIHAVRISPSELSEQGHASDESLRERPQGP